MKKFDKSLIALILTRTFAVLKISFRRSETFGGRGGGGENGTKPTVIDVLGLILPLATWLMTFD